MSHATKADGARRPADNTLQDDGPIQDKLDESVKAARKEEKDMRLTLESQPEPPSRDLDVDEDQESQIRGRPRTSSYEDLFPRPSSSKDFFRRTSSSGGLFSRSSTYEDVFPGSSSHEGSFLRSSSYESLFPRSSSYEDLTYHDRQLGNAVPLPPRAEHDGEDRRRQESLIPQRRYSPAAELTAQATRPLLLTFDAFDTLFTPKEPIGKQYCDVARQFGLEFKEDKVMASFKTAFKTLNKSHPNYGRGNKGWTPEKWWTTLISRTLTPLLPRPSPSISDISDTLESSEISETPETNKSRPTPRPTLPPALAETLYTHFSTSAAYTLFPDVAPFLHHIGTASYSASQWAPRRTMLGILSNSDPRVRSILSSFPPPLGPIPIHASLFPARYMPHSRRTPAYAFGPAHFAFACLSYEAGVAKPDRRIFDKAVRMAQRSLNSLHFVARGTRTGRQILGDVRSEFHCLHVGDSKEMDVIGAVRAGWDVVLLDREMKEGIRTRVVKVPADEWDEKDEFKGWTEEEREKKARYVEITVVNSLMQLRHVVTKERLEGKDSPHSQVGKPVWIEPGKELIRTRFLHRRETKGRRLADSPRGDGTKILL